MVFAFAEAFKMKEQEAFLYLKKYGGWDYITENWWALHTENSFWALSDIFDICKNNGGLR